MDSNKISAEMQYRKRQSDTLDQSIVLDEIQRRTRGFYSSLSIIPFNLDEKKLLDVGSGNCWPLILIKEKYPNTDITALDMSLELFANAQLLFATKKIKGVKMTCGGFDKLPFKNETFGVVTAFASLHHALNLEIVLNEIYRVLKPEGILYFAREPVASMFPPLKLIETFMFSRKERKEGATEKIYTLKEWKEYLSKSGFEIISLTMDESKGISKFIYHIPLPQMIKLYLIGGALALVASK